MTFRRLIPFLLLILSPLAWSQVTLTANSGVVSSNGILFAQGTYSINLVSSTGQDLTNAPLTVGGVTLSVPSQVGKLSATGTFTITLPLANSSITSPTGTQYRLSICSINPVTQPSNVPLPPQVCFAYTATFNSSTDLSTTLSALAPPIQIPNGCPTGATGNCTISGNLTVNGTINTIFYAAPGSGTISSAITNALAINPGGSFRINLACGTYKDNLILNNLNSIFISAPIRGYGYGGANFCTILNPLVPANPAITIEATGPTGANSSNGISGLNIACPLGTTCGDGILITGYSPALFGANYVSIDDTTISGNPNSATLGFNHNININGGLLSATFTRVQSIGGFTAGLSMTGSNPQNDIHCKSCLFQNSYGYGVFISSTASTGPSSIDFDDSVFQFNGYNTSNVGVGATCAGLYSNGVTTANIHHSYFEGNCRGNTSGQPIADVRLTGSTNQAFNIQANNFFQDWNEYGIYNDTTQTSGDYSGNQFTNSPTAIYVATVHALSDIHIGTNFNFTSTVVADVNGNTHVSTTSPSGDSVGVITTVASNTIAAGIADRLEIYNGPFTISNITGGYAGRLLKLTAVTGNQVINTSGSGGNQIFLMGGATSETIPQGESVILYYSPHFAHWQEIAEATNYSATSLAIGGGTAMTGNQGTGVKAQHSTGTLTSGNLLKADATGNAVDASVTPVLVNNCGTTTTCANTATTTPRFVWGVVTLTSGTPSTAVVSGMTAWTSTSSYTCTVSNTTTQANPVKWSPTSTTSITITGPNTVTDIISYICVGN